MNMTFGDKALAFYVELSPPRKLPGDVVALNPHVSDGVLGYLTAFLSKYYNDSRKRTLVFGINPGRLGGGSTGVPFTDAVAMEKECGIKNTLPKKRELSSQFIYLFANHWGGPERLFKEFFFTAVCPFGFVRAGKNFNYYEDREFLNVVADLIVSSIRAQIQFGVSTDSVILLGTGKNRDVFESINDRYGFFRTVHVLEHPRFIMQYKRKSLDTYIEKYTQIFLRSAPYVQ